MNHCSLWLLQDATWRPPVSLWSLLPANCRRLPRICGFTDSTLWRPLLSPGHWWDHIQPNEHAMDFFSRVFVSCNHAHSTFAHVRGENGSGDFCMGLNPCSLSVSQLFLTWLPQGTWSLLAKYCIILNRKFWNFVQGVHGTPHPVHRSRMNVTSVSVEVQYSSGTREIFEADCMIRPSPANAYLESQASISSMKFWQEHEPIRKLHRFPNGLQLKSCQAWWRRGPEGAGRSDTAETFSNICAHHHQPPYRSGHSLPRLLSLCSWLPSPAVLPVSRPFPPSFTRPTPLLQRTRVLMLAATFFFKIFEWGSGYSVEGKWAFPTFFFSLSLCLMTCVWRPSWGTL